MIESVFKVIRYRTMVYDKRKLRYPAFKVYGSEEIYFKTLDDVENYMREQAFCYEQMNSNRVIPYDGTYIDTYAYVVIEIPLNMELSISLSGNHLSVRIYQRDGTLWGKNLYANFFPSLCANADEYNYWGRRNTFWGREPEEIKFNPGDIVEVFGYPGNGYWSENEVHLAIIVKTPPTVTDVAAMRQHYMETHSGFDLCDHALSFMFGRRLDTYEVIYGSSEGCIDHASTISVFEPIKAISAKREKALRCLYMNYLNTREIK